MTYYLNEGGKVVFSGRNAHVPFLSTPPNPPSNSAGGLNDTGPYNYRTDQVYGFFYPPNNAGDDRRPHTAFQTLVPVSNDVLEYYFGVTARRNDSGYGRSNLNAGRSTPSPAASSTAWARSRSTPRRPTTRTRTSTGSTCRGPSLQGPQGVQGIQGIQGPQGIQGRRASRGRPARQVRPVAPCWCRAHLSSSGQSIVFEMSTSRPTSARLSASVRLAGTKLKAAGSGKNGQVRLRLRSSRRIARRSEVVVKVTIGGRSARMVVPLGKTARLALKKR